MQKKSEILFQVPVEGVSAGKETYIGHLILVGVVKNVIQDVDLSLGLDSDSCAHAQAVNVLDELLGARFGVAVGLRRLSGGGVDGGLIVEAIQVATGFLEILDPFLWLLEPVSVLLLC